MNGCLFLVPTPIGNLSDFTDRSKEALENAQLIACEDTRNTQKLLTLLGIRTQASLIAYHEYNADKMRPVLISYLQEGKNIALVSDAGCPLVSDPGYRLARDVLDLNIPVIPLPGANAILPALQISGLPSDHFFFNGFLSSKQHARQEEIKKLVDIPATLIFYESPHRVLETLKDLKQILGDRSAAVVRELTKKFEESKRGQLSKLIAFYEKEGSPKGEIVILVDRSDKNEPVSFDVTALLSDALKRLPSLRDAVDEVTLHTGLDRRKIYKQALEIKNGQA